jgi:hypothetical protein
MQLADLCNEHTPFMPDNRVYCTYFYLFDLFLVYSTALAITQITELLI